MCQILHIFPEGYFINYEEDISKKFTYGKVYCMTIEANFKFQSTYVFILYSFTIYIS